MVRSGAHSVRLGNSQSGSDAERLTYTFKVTPKNALFSFSYAVVLQNPSGHDSKDKPYFGFKIYRGTPASPGGIIRQFVKYADAADSYFTNGPSDIVYKSWDCEQVSLVPACLMGDTVTVEFTTADCALGQHFGYAYIDGLCEPPDNGLHPSFTLPSEICWGDRLLTDGSTSVGELDHAWSIEESDDCGRRKPGTERKEWFTAQEAGPIDLTSWSEGKRRRLECGKTYRVTLSVRNSCAGWKETSKQIYVRCGPPLALPRLVDLCCNSRTLRLGPAGPLPPNTTYEWSSDPPGFFSLDPNPVVTVDRCQIIYTLVATGPQGCQTAASTTVRVVEDFTLQILAQPLGLCGQHRLLAQATSLPCPDCTRQAGRGLAGEPSVLYSWGSGQNSAVVTVNPSSATTYTVTVQNSCFTHTASIVVPPCQRAEFCAPPPDVIIPNTIRPGSPIEVNRTSVVAHIDFANPIPLGSAPAYNATEYVFVVYSRWGNIVSYRHGIAPTSGFRNGEIRWNGRWDSDNKLVPEGAYPYALYLKNCHGWFGGYEPSDDRVRNRQFGWKNGDFTVEY